MLKYGYKIKFLEVIVINSQTYEKMVSFFKNNKIYKNILKFFYKVFPIIIFISYGILIIYSFITKNNKLLKIIVVPLCTFMVVTIFRKIFNRQRPYQKFGIQSVFNKTKDGQSMPSRHTASAFIIAMAILFLNFKIGIIYLILSLFIAISRVLAGVHFVSDVLVGMFISILSGIIFFFII